MRNFKDQMQFEVQIPIFPQRIISLVPSQTELLFDLGLENQVLGITKFCIHPKEKTRQKIKIGGTKKFNFELIDSLQPDLIIGNKEENYKEGIEKLKEKYPVWMSDIADLDQAYDMMITLGEVTGKSNEAQHLVDKIKLGFEELKTIQFDQKKNSVAYFIWRKPYMLAGGGTFIHYILEACGWENALVHTDRYPEITTDELRELSPDYIFLSSEPFPFKGKHVEEIQLICPESKVCIVDGEMFSWYGSRLQYSVDYFKSLIEGLSVER